VPGSNFSDLDLCSVSAVQKENSFTFYKTTPNGEGAGVAFSRDKGSVSASPSHTSLYMFELVNWCV
jgi:hypothetical protein